MRITSELFVAQLTRRIFKDGGFAAILRKGAEAAGAIFVVARARDGAVTLYGPAPQSFASDEDGGERRFLAEPIADEAAIEARFAREARFDPDFWVIEIETERAGDYLPLVG
ncbi:hypothetical protein GCM10011390_10790 [Aureimonas endophytica]|uniref:DUF1491 family protein n=1 Tax=Aureimonas endophytica TaxID=2027858 RepID=A0A917E1U0_9HYPH|nr:DUF1491 family protein [Aureimonas endophytica]GGD93917.1 hypothetical protein GCM10011390_10790 [Aureimonas endophytica]